ncbi:MAG: M56 family metallopeptidase, partial [Lachnospiraceae bacterium]|nr:M56 family metallopeptidase [Lachnospiraceae bacterium]
LKFIDKFELDHKMRFFQSAKLNDIGCEEKLNIKTRVELSCNSLIASPMLIGFFRPRIVLPIGQLEDKELSYIFVHELIHYKQGDMFYKWLIQMVVCAHWFNPFVYLLEKEVNKSCELSCDEKVISVLGDKAKREYGDTLIYFLKPDNLYKSSLASVTLTEGAEQIKERLGAIMKFRKKSKVVIAITTIFTAAACACFFVTGAYAAPSVTNDMKMWKDSEILNEVLTDNGVYYIFCEGADEKDKPQASVSVGSIQFVLVRKDSWTSIGPFENKETLLEDVTEQCKYMKNLTEKEKGLVIETAAKIVEANVEVWLSGITKKNEMTIYPKCIFPMSKGDIFYIEYNDSVSGTSNVGLIGENGEKLEAETTVWEEGDTASIEVTQDGSYYFYMEGFNDNAGWFNTTFKFIVSYE